MLDVGNAILALITRSDYLKINQLFAAENYL